MLGRFTVRLPIYHIESQVTFRTPRVPTVFERMIMRLCTQYRDVPELAGQSPLAVFRDHLGVGDARELLDISMSNLIAVEAIDRPRGVSALETPLAELKLTGTGESFWRDNLLPGSPKTEPVAHLFDPLTQLTVSSDGRARRGREPMSDDAPLAVLLRPASPESIIGNVLDGERYPWKLPTTRIEQVDSYIVGVQGGEHAIELSLNDEGTLSLQTPDDPVLANWLARAEPEIVWDALMADILEAPDTGEPLADASLLRGAQVQPRMVEPRRGSRAYLRIVLAGAAMDVDDAEHIIAVSPNFDQPEFIENGDGREVLVMPLREPLEHGFVDATLAAESLSPSVRIDDAFRLYWAGQPRRCGLHVTLSGAAAASRWVELRASLEASCEKADDARIAMLPALWRDPAAVVDAWFGARAHRSFGELLTFGEQCLTALANWPGAGRRTASEVVERILSDRLLEAAARTMPEPLPHVAAITALQRIGELLPAKAAALQTAFLANVAPVADANTLAAIRAAMSRNAAIPAELILPALRQFWIDETVNGAQPPLHGPHAFVDGLQSLKETIDTVGRDVGERALEAARSHSIDPRSLTSRALSTLARWRTVRGLVADGMDSPRFRALDEALERWDLLARERLAAPESGRRIVVIDTNALLDRPALLDDLPPHDSPVIPLRVLHELDGLKSSDDPKCAADARAAIRQLELRKPDYAQAHPELLPAELATGQADDDILSVAQYHRLSDVVLLSNDINLRNKAVSLGLAAEATPGQAVQPAAPAGHVKSKKKWSKA
ncbi:PIN domain-containing protein [Paraburkholderia sp. RL17-347-BIC-D]|uniref:PIN domain-containing protein n=1 Tax=Paraburkholderia sp. RL17-347-BIC-D TaxID=3031632 RepID=UPI0038BAD75D